MPLQLSRERAAMFAVWGLAALACLLGLVSQPPLEGHSADKEQLLDLLRVLTTTCLVIALLLGPGLLWRAASVRRVPSLGFLPLPGLALLAATATIAWALAGSVEPRVTCFAILGPLLGLELGALVGLGPEDVLAREEQRALLIVGCALGFAIAKALWSLGPEGELYGGTISRTLEVGDRSDSRIPFILPQLVSRGAGPYSPVATSFFYPCNFSCRGPLPGLASTPPVLMAGTHPPLGFAEEPWTPFDAGGFMAFRLGMMAFASTAFLSLWDLVRRIGGYAPARLAVLLAAATPFLVHEIWFTWPKLLAASFVLLSGICIVERWPLRAGLLLGTGYLMHPSALLALSGLGLLALWPLRGADWRHPRLKDGVLLAAGVALFVLAWRFGNGSHFMQNGFLEFFREAGINTPPAAPGPWAVYRAGSVASTLVPMFLPLVYAHDFTLNVFLGTSPFIIHFFFQYWDTLPFGVGILFYPVLLVGLWRAWRLWRWPVFASVIAPFVFFALYWGATRTGMLREGLHAWVLVLLGVVALQQGQAGFSWLRSKPVKAILALRPLELLLIAIGPAVATGQGLISSEFAITDIAALLAMVGFAVLLGRVIWSTTPETLGSELSLAASEPAPTRLVAPGSPPG